MNSNDKQTDSIHHGTKIIIASNNHKSRTVSLDKAVVTIGRSYDNDIVLEGAKISRYHACLEQAHGGWQVIDLSSTNGVLLADGRLTPSLPVIWQPEQPLHIGSYSLCWSRQPFSKSSSFPLPPLQNFAPEPAPVSPDMRRHTAQPSLAGPPASAAIVSGNPPPPPAFPLASRQQASPSSPSRYLPTATLGLIWLLVIIGIPGYLPIQVASWLTFVALLITPGYFLGHIMTWRLDLDWFERLALALPLGLTIIAVPGIVSLLLHLTLNQLLIGWIIASILVGLSWLLHGWWQRTPARLSGEIHYHSPKAWAADELILLGFLAVAFILILPTLSLHKIDGDAFAVSTFTADALANLPLNAHEPLFGTSLGPGVRMVFNQSLPMFYLWTYLADIDPITLTAAASRNIIALWALLAAYTLGKAAGGSRRFGLYTAAIQLLIYLAAPFWRGDNVSLFFFERSNADKFMVLITMLPVVFAFAIRFVRFGRRDNWLAAAVATLAVSAVHPLIAAMLALGLAAFAGVHLLFSLGDRLARQRVTALAGLVALAIFLPLVQLVLSRGEAPLAPSYPSSFEGWSIGEEMVPILPSLHARTLSLYGPLPDLAQLDASATNSTTNPFLIWRFAVNMERQRLILFDIDHYISDPRLILEPTYLLALFLLFFLLKHIRRSIAAQFVVGVSAGVLLTLFNPLIMPLIGSLVMPWILWRLVWLFPYALIIALATHRLLTWTVTAVFSYLYRRRRRSLPAGKLPLYKQVALAGFIIIAALFLSPAIIKNFRTLNQATPTFFPAPQRILAHLDELTAAADSVLVLADQNLSVTISAYIAKADILAHRVPNTSEIFPADMQDVALQRLIDQEAFFESPYLTTRSVDILQQYQAGYIVVASGSDLDLQLRLAPQWFEWLLDDKSYSLYFVREMPERSASIQGNTAMKQRQWDTAVQLYEKALDANPNDLLAQIGLVESAQSQGQFDVALGRLQQIMAQGDWPILHYRLGQLYAEWGLAALSIQEFDKAQQAAPQVSRFHAALGDACLHDQQLTCAATQYHLAAANENFPDQAAGLIAEADLWRQQGRTDQALPLYEQAAALNPSAFNQLILESAYRELGQWERAQAVVASLQRENPFSADIMAASANAMAAQNRVDEAITLYRYAIRLQNMQAQETTNNRLALAELLLQNNRVDEARRQTELLLNRQPYNAAVYRLQGDLFRQQRQFDQALVAYQRAFALDPSQIANYNAFSDQLRQSDGQPDEMVAVLTTAVNANPNEATLLLALGDHWQRQGQAQAAIDAYHAALTQLDPYLLFLPLRPQGERESRAVVNARLARIYEDQGQIETAMHYYRAAVAAAPDIPWTQVLLGDAWRRRNETDAAAAAYRQAIEYDATYVSAYVRLAELLYAQGNQEAGESLYDQALPMVLAQVDALPGTADGSDKAEIAPQPTFQPVFSDETPDGVDYPPVVGPTTSVTQLFNGANERVNAVRVFTRLRPVYDRTNEAITLYQRQIEQGEAAGWPPTVMAQYYKGLGDLHLALLQFSEAVAAYQAAVDFDNWWPEARLGLAEALAGLGDTAAAFAQWQMATAIAPGSAEAQIALAAALEQRGDSDQALAIYRETAQAHPGDARATLTLARAWQGRNNLAAAGQIYRQTILMNPNTADAYNGLAELAMAESQLVEAESYLQKAIAADRQNINTHFHLAELEQRQGNAAEALVWYQRAAALPLNDQSINITLIDSLLQYGDFSAALAQIEDGLTRRPGHPDLLLRLGLVQYQLSEFEKAENTFIQATELNNNDSRLYAELAEFYVVRGRTEEALDYYRQAIDLEPDESGYYLAVYRVWRSQGRFDQAVAALQAGQNQAAEPAVLYTALANFYLLRGQPDLAFDILQHGLTDVGENLELQLALGAYYESRAKFARAEQLYHAAVESWPEAAAVQIALADWNLRQNNTDAALSHYQQAIALEPADPGHYLSLGNAYLLTDRLDEAALAYRQAFVLAPNMENAYVSLGALYQDQARWDEAQVIYEQGLAAAPRSPLLLTQYGLYWLARGDSEKALTWLDQAVAAAPTATALIVRASVYGELGQIEAGEQDLLTAVQNEPGSIEALIALGDWYSQQNDLAQAERLYQQAILLMPGVPTGYLRLGNLANDRGDRTAAQQYEEAAEAADPGSFVR